MTPRLGSYPRITKNRSRLHIGFTSGRTHSDVSSRLVINKPSAPQLRSILSGFGMLHRRSPHCPGDLIGPQGYCCECGAVVWSQSALYYGQRRDKSVQTCPVPRRSKNLPLPQESRALNIMLQHRAKFQPNMFHHTSPDEESAKKDPEHASRANTAVLDEPKVQKPRPKFTTWKMTVRRLSQMERYRSAAKGDDPSTKSRVLAMERGLRKTGAALQSIEEVWFAGCHADVGGLYPTSCMSCCPSF